jgi:RNA-directed DNA polymerase
MEGSVEQGHKRWQGNGAGTLIPGSLSTKLNRVAEMAKQKTFVFRTLAHLITEEALAWSFRELRRDAAAGVDEVTVRDYEADLSAKLRDLHQRLRMRRYQAQPLRRVYIEKEDGKQRPLSIPVLEDKIVQKAVTSILERIYEADFLPCSYGYRPNRSAREAVEAINKRITFERVNWVLEADIQDYFGSILREELKRMLQKRIQDADLLRLIGKWLHVGVVDDGQLLMSEDGTYQGSVISPILANVYLHEVLDLWVEKDVKPRMKGPIALYRFADDFVVCFETRSDAERFQEVLPKRFAKYGLKLHPTKTRLLAFGRAAAQEAERTGRRKPETFGFLGFTFYWGKTRTGAWTVKYKTMAKRIRRGLLRWGQWCKQNRHRRLVEQHERLKAVLRGHYQYYGLPTNSRSLARFREGAILQWRKWLGRRDRATAMTWQKFHTILERYPLPAPRIYPLRARCEPALLFGEWT